MQPMFHAAISEIARYIFIYTKFKYNTCMAKCMPYINNQYSMHFAIHELLYTRQDFKTEKRISTENAISTTNIAIDVLWLVV